MLSRWDVWEYIVLTLIYITYNYGRLCDFKRLTYIAYFLTDGHRRWYFYRCSPCINWQKVIIILHMPSFNVITMVMFYYADPWISNKSHCKIESASDGSVTYNTVRCRYKAGHFSPKSSQNSSPAVGELWVQTVSFTLRQSLKRSL